MKWSWEISRAQTRQAFKFWQKHCTALTNMCNWDIDFPFAVKVADFMNFERTSSVANSVMYWRIRTFLVVPAALLYTVHCNQANGVMHWRIRTFLVVPAALLYTVHCNQENAIILVEILVIRVCSTWSFILTSTVKRNLYCV